MSARQRVLVAMSGGVDSSLAAALLVRQGFEVQGITLRLNPCEDQALGKSCCGVDAVLSARQVADQLGIEHAVLDVRREFEARVLKPAWSDYSRGRTPSPCVLCNQEIKFGLLLERARALGAPRIASGHYARIAKGEDGSPRLLRARDSTKDQSYFLFSLSPDQLDSLMLPLGEMTKAEVRAMARELSLSPAERADSQDACLSISEDGFAESLRQRFEEPALTGPFVDSSGKILGEHPGLHRFTVGQRRGLGISLGARAFVQELRADGAVVLTSDEKALWSAGLTARLVRPLPGSFESVSVQIRSRHAAVPARLERAEGLSVQLRFEQPQRAVTPGQAAVIYDGERVLGGGWIERALPS